MTEHNNDKRTTTTTHNQPGHKRPGGEASQDETDKPEDKAPFSTPGSENQSPKLEKSHGLPWGRRASNHPKDARTITEISRHLEQTLRDAQRIEDQLATGQWTARGNYLLSPAFLPAIRREIKALKLTLWAIAERTRLDED